MGSAQVIEHRPCGVVAREVEHAGLQPPPGQELFRFATVNDVHIGLDTFGMLPRIRDPLRSEDPPAERCLRAAVAEATAWGAELLVAKGDIVQRGTVDEVARAAALLTGGGVPVVALVGNHEVRLDADAAGRTFARAGIPLVRDGVAVRTAPGIDIVMFDSTVPGRHLGTYDRFADDVVDAVAGATGPVVLLTHHHPQPLPVFHHWPPGIPSPEARRLFDRLVRVNPNIVMSTGHTHRHRRHDHGPLIVTEVGSPQHYPGTWAGYAVHEGGIRQVVRRVAAPDAIVWTEATRRMLLGLWARWSTGPLAARCFSRRWEKR